MNYFRITLVLGSIFILVYISTIGIKNIVRYNGFSLEYNNLVLDYEQAKEKQRRFNLILGSIQKDGHIELLAKERLGYIKKNEKMIKFINE